MTTSLGLTLLTLLLLFSFSIFFSGSETAFFSLQELDRRKLVEQDHRAAPYVASLLQNRTSMITTILIGNEVANTAITTTTATLMAGLAHSSPWVNILLVTPTLILVADVTPKVLGFRFNRRWATTVAPVLYAIRTLLTPVRWLVERLVTQIARRFGVTSTIATQGLGEDDFLTLVERSRARGVVNDDERNIIEAVFELGDLAVYRVMTPRPDMFSLALDTPWPQLIAACREAHFSRIPLWEHEPDNIVGVLLVKDLLRYRHEPPQDLTNSRTILLTPVFVPSSKPANDLMKEMIRKRIHIAFVIDEHGTLIGLVSLDDLIMELVGELHDDTSEEISLIQPQQDGTWSIRGSIDLDDLQDQTNICAPEGEYHTLSGWFLDALGRIPKIGDVLDHDGYHYKIVSMDERRVGEVLVTHKPTPDTTEDAS